LKECKDITQRYSLQSFPENGFCIFLLGCAVNIIRHKIETLISDAIWDSITGQHWDQIPSQSSTRLLNIQWNRLIKRYTTVLSRQYEGQKGGESEKRAGRDGLEVLA